MLSYSQPRVRGFFKLLAADFVPKILEIKTRKRKLVAYPLTLYKLADSVCGIT